MYALFAKEFHFTPEQTANMTPYQQQMLLNNYDYSLGNDEKTIRFDSVKEWEKWKQQHGR